VSPPPESRETSLTLRLALVLSMVGGFLDAYTYLSRNGVFATAQTGNIVLMVVAGARDEWPRAAQHLPPIAAFLAGVLAAEVLRRPAVVRLVRRPARVAIGFEAAVLAVVGFLPSGVPDLVVTALIAFTAALQISSFSTVARWAYNSTMTTGNLRSVVRAAFRARLDHDAEARREAFHIGGVVVAFTLGVGIGCALTLLTGDRAVWVAAGVLVVSLAFFVLDERVRPG
jgi:uncharacterized membrane protein YoaK (UPF0700 family)